MQEASHGLVERLMALPIFEAEWVLYLLIGLSLASVAAMLERVWFYRQHKVDVDALRPKFDALLAEGNYSGAAELLAKHDALETNVVLFALKEHAQGPESVEDLLSGAMRKEQERYSKRLNFLATVASNAPFVGLFGTVLGIIRAFQDLSGNMAEASDSVMGGIAEALIATAVGLLVAIPAVVAFNVFKDKVKSMVNDAHLLSSILLARLKAFDPKAGS